MQKNTILKNVTLALAVIGLMLFSSCKDETQPESTEPAQSQTTPGAENGENQQTVQVNPAHGLPGHRCDLPVGAPLNSAASNTNEATPQPTSSSTVSPVRIDQTPKINPPHGQPGHDCTVPVGAELN